MTNEETQTAYAQKRADNAKHNCITHIAHGAGRTYITPEDVSEALQNNPEEPVRLHTLEVLGKISGFGAEDSGLCAFVAFQGKEGA